MNMFLMLILKPGKGYLPAYVYKETTWNRFEIIYNHHSSLLYVLRFVLFFFSEQFITAWCCDTSESASDDVWWKWKCCPMQPKADDKVGWATLGQQPYNIDNNNQPFSSLQHRCRPSQSPSHADLGDNWYFQHQPFESSTFSSFVAGRISICFREIFVCALFVLLVSADLYIAQDARSSPHRW